MLEEPESAPLRRALRVWPRRASSLISAIEVLRAVRRREATALWDVLPVLRRVALLRVSDRVLATAAGLDPPGVRTLDAIHVATALRLRSGLTAFVSYDLRQLEAAEAAGLPCMSPR